jgi:hypothetical protein
MYGETVMPTKDPEKKKAQRERYNANKRQERQSAWIERNKILGHHTTTSLNWPKPMLTESQCAWIAACLDCEGCLSLGSYWNKQRSSYNFHVKMQVQMTEPAVVRRLLELCGGSLHLSKEKRFKNHRDIWSWHLSSNGVRWLLPQIISHLLIKKQQAIMVLEFLTISKRGVSCRAEYNTRAQEIRVIMARLNRRGAEARKAINAEPFIEAI